MWMRSRCVWVLFPCAVACGSSHADQHPGSAAGQGGAGLGGASGAGGRAEPSGCAAVAGGAGEGNEGGAAGLDTARGSGRISLVSLPGSPEFEGAYALATFAAPGARDRGSVTHVGDCELRACVTPPERTDAGRLYLVSSPSGYHETIDPTDGVYPPDVAAGIYPAEGDPVTVGAVGHQVPQFSVYGTMPSGVVVPSPARPTSGVVTVPRSEAFVLSWDGGAEGVRVELEATDLDTSVHCGADAPLGRLTIPESVLAALEPGTPLVVTTSTFTTVIAAAHELEASSAEYEVTLRTAVGVYDESHQRLDFMLE